VVLLIDNYDSFTCNLAHLLAGHGCRLKVIRSDQAPARQIVTSAPGGIVISPGPGTPADAGISIPLVRACGPATPLPGVRLGHQVIAAAYGASIVAAPQPAHGQACAITHDGGGLLAGPPRHVPAARYHSLITDQDTLPPDLLITARGPAGIPMGLRHARHRAEGVQFHPESILTTHGDTITANFTQAARGHRSTTADEMRGRSSRHLRLHPSRPPLPERAAQAGCPSLGEIGPGRRSPGRPAHRLLRLLVLASVSGRLAGPAAPAGRYRAAPGPGTGRRPPRRPGPARRHPAGRHRHRHRQADPGPWPGTVLITVFPAPIHAEPCGRRGKVP
jgi:anthranilate synthase component II